MQFGTLQKEFQKKVFYENDFLTVLNPENKPIDNVENYVSGFLSSISLEAPDTKQGKDKKAGNLLERPYSISMEGSDGKIISRFLNELVVSANSETFNDFINITNQKIAFPSQPKSIDCPTKISAFPRSIQWLR